MKLTNNLFSMSLLLAVLAVSTIAQQTVVQKPDGSYTVIEYPVGTEVSVKLIPYSTATGAQGVATVLRADDGTKIAVELNSVSDSAKRIFVYAVDPQGATRFLGPINLSEGSGKADFTTDLSQFMLVLSPDESVTAWNSGTQVFFRSEVPQGHAVVPTAKTADTKAVASTGAIESAYQVPMLNVPGYNGKTTEIRIAFGGDLSGLKGKAYIDPGAEGTTQVKMRFDDMKQAPKNKRLILWASSPDGEFTKLGQVIITGERQESEIRSETSLPDFGLFVTLEETDVVTPTSKIYTALGKI